MPIHLHNLIIYLQDSAHNDAETDNVQFRSSGRRDRPGRTQIDHDVFEGLPIRQWKQVDAPVGPPPVAAPVLGKASPWPELPMPRDWQMLPEVSQQLLRAARAGKLYKPPTPPNEEEEEKGDEDAETAIKESPKGFLARKWSQVPRHQETPEKEYLAKRRKGLLGAVTGGDAVQPVQAAPAPPAVRMTKVRRLDADGNAVIYEVQALEGQPVEGEIVEEVVTTEAAPIVATVAPGTIIEGVGVANAEGLVVAATEGVLPTPPRRKPPPPRKKKKGPGRGHKKVVVIEPGMEGVVPAVITIGPDGLPTAPATLADGAAQANGDTAMADAGEGEEDESGEEGEEGDESEDEEGSEEGELADAPNPESDAAVSNLPPPPTSQPLSGLSAEPAPPLSDSLPGIMSDAAVDPMVTPLSPPTTDAVAPPPEALLSPAKTEPPPLDPMDTSEAPAADAQPHMESKSLPENPIADTVSHVDPEALQEDSAVPPPVIAPVEEPPRSAGATDLFGSLERHLDGQETAHSEQSQISEAPADAPALPEKPVVEELEEPRKQEATDEPAQPAP